jgi:hypothetical protein
MVEKDEDQPRTWVELSGKVGYPRAYATLGMSTARMYVECAKQFEQLHDTARNLADDRSVVFLRSAEKE